MAVSQDRLSLPWSTERQENRRFTAILVLLFILLFVFSIWIPMITVPEKDRDALEKLPPQLAKLVKNKKEPKPIKKEEPKPLLKAERVCWLYRMICLI